MLKCPVSAAFWCVVALGLTSCAPPKTDLLQNGAVEIAIGKSSEGFFENISVLQDTHSITISGAVPNHLGATDEVILEHADLFASDATGNFLFSASIPYQLDNPDSKYFKFLVSFDVLPGQISFIGFVHHRDPVNSHLELTGFLPKASP